MSGPHSGGPPLAGRHALVTGAARGIGAAIAQALAADGASVTLLGRDAAALAVVAARLPGGPHGIAVADVTDADALAVAFEAARRQLGPLHILVNNAGAAESAPFAKTSSALWTRMLAVNLTGTFLATQAAWADLLAAGAAARGADDDPAPRPGGRIVNVASTAGQRGYAYVSAYAAAKHGVIGLTRSLALELARKGVTVNAVCPGYTETDLLRGSIDRVVATTGRSADDARAGFAASNPQQRLVQPAEVAALVAWLCRAEAGSITGQALSVSGGEVMA
jgi:NAD(P)-dependent dehydrogenase (short-subunit alcohol dehydrogenase family)